MVDVCVEIFGSSSLQPPQHFNTKYIIKTFWCRNLEIEDTNTKSSSHSLFIRVPHLLKSDYRNNVDKKVGINLFIEIWYTPSITRDGDQSSSKFVGLSRFSLDEQLNNPNLNPVWTYLPINRMLPDSVIGKLGVKISATLTFDENTGVVDCVSSYFSSSGKSDPALICPPHLVSKHIKSKNDQVQISNHATPSQATKIIKENNKNRPSSGATKRTTTNTTIKTITTNVKKSTSEKKLNAARPEQDKKPWSTSKKGQTVPASPQKVPSAVSHNMLTSPDFPFKIPAVEAAENKIKFNLNAEKNGSSRNFTESTNSSSPTLFGWTPYVPRRFDHEGGTFDEESFQSIIQNKPTSKDKRSLNVDEIVSVLNDSFNKTLGNKVEEMREQNKEAELVKILLHERDDPNDHRKRVTPFSNRISLLESEEIQSPTRLCFPKQNTIAPQSKTSSYVPGMKITQYKSSIKNGSENLANPFKSPSRRRIAANIYHD